MNLSPLPIQKFFANNGRPLVGGRLFTYVAGTDTKIATYTDASGGTPNTNPIELDFRGECRLWIDPQQAYKFILAQPGNDDPPTNPIWTVDNITAAPADQDNTAVDTGSANNVELSIPRISAPVAFMRIIFRAAATNTGPVTLSINGGTDNPITWQNLATFTGGEIQQNGIYEVIFDGARWQLQGPTLQPPQMRSPAEITAGVVPDKYPMPVFNVLRYGAVADGVPSTGAGTDNSAAFQRAVSIAAVFGSSGGGEVYIPAGVYRLDSGFSVPPGVTVRGDGKWSSLLFCPSSFSDVAGLIRFNGSGGPPAKLQSCGVISQTGGAGGNGVVVTSNGTFIDDVWVGGFTGPSSAGIVLDSTDLFVTDFAVELCLYGIEVRDHGTSINVSHGTLYACLAAGALINNGVSVENGRVIFNAIRATDCVQDGFVISDGKCVTLAGCASIATDNTKNTSSGVLVDSSNDVIIDGFSARVTGTSSTAGAGVRVNASTAVVINGCKARGFQDGARITSCNEVSLSGGLYHQNGRRGVYVSAGDNISITGAVATDNSDSGIYDDNTDTNCNHAIIGCTVQSNTTYGIFANITQGSALSNITGNTARFNGTTDISYNGLTQNFGGTGNIPGPFGLGSIPSVASAANIALPFRVPIVSITGTTTITNITATGHFGNTVILHLISGGLQLTDGGNLVLAGNFVSTALSTITLFCNGTNWFEIARSSNS